MAKTPTARPLPRLDLPVIDKGRRLTGTDRQQFAEKVVAAYREPGVTIARICEATSRSYGAIHQLLSEAGATKRRPTPAAGQVTR